METGDGGATGGGTPFKKDADTTGMTGVSPRKNETVVVNFRQMLLRLSKLITVENIVDLAFIMEVDEFTETSEMNDRSKMKFFRFLLERKLIDEGSTGKLIQYLDDIDANPKAIQLVEEYSRYAAQGGRDTGPSGRETDQTEDQPEDMDSQPSTPGGKGQAQKTRPTREEQVFKFLEYLGFNFEADLPKLNRQNCTTIDITHLQDTPLTPANAVKIFINRTLSYDFRAMRIFKELDFSPSNPNSASNKRAPKMKLSCRDVLFALFNACDPFLRQELLTKLSACQIAIPILLPDTKHKDVTFLLWSLQNTVKAWECPAEMKVYEESVVKFPFPVIFTAKFGNPPVSKSHILNKVLGPLQGNKEHSYFLSKEDDSTRSAISKGTLEAVWYLPNATAEGKHVLPMHSCFLNLRGDATNFSKQLNYGVKNATMIIIFMNAMTDENISQFEEWAQTSKVILVLACADVVEEALQYFDSNDNIGMIDGSEVGALEISEEICIEIRKSLENPTKAKSKALTDTQEICEELGIRVDVLDSACAGARDAAQRILNSSVDDIKVYKTSSLPMQLHWLKWSKLDKDRSWRSVSKNTDKELAHIHKQKTEQRDKQRKAGVSQVVAEIYQQLSENDVAYNNYLVFWLVHGLNQMSFTSLRPLNDAVKTLHDKLRETASGLSRLQRALTDPSNSSNQIQSFEQEQKRLIDLEESFKNELTNKTKEYDECSVGFEHFIREFGQIYESYHDHDGPIKNSKIKLDVLPVVVAELVISGHPVEIFDGDAGHVPIKWVQAVLKAVSRKLNNGRVYVISVIGIQSSGKSTLLNSMFGVRFAVSAGRCTRGVFLQLLRVTSEMQEELKCQYVAIIDTEGLKAPEKAIADRKDEDNELATFALCLSDVTLINIGGQTVGEDLSNILQISAHAFIRMKEVQLRSSCYLIQQFVADITAKYRNQNSTQSILQTLDQAVISAAKDEGKHDQYRQFSDCFDMVNIGKEDSKSVQYIPSLWASSMSAPNHGYSEQLSKLKSQLLQGTKQKGNKERIGTILEFSERVSSVWDAIKQEDFVFGFRNTAEIHKYNRFTNMYKKLQLSFQKDMMKWELDAKEKIKNSTADRVMDQLFELERELSRILDDGIEEQTASLHEEFDSGEFESVKYHSTYFFQDLALLRRKMEATAKEMLKTEAMSVRNAEEKDKKLKPQIKSDLRAKVLPVAERFKQTNTQNFDDIMIDDAFEEVWKEQMDDINRRFTTETDAEIRNRIKHEIPTCLEECLGKGNLTKDMKRLFRDCDVSNFSTNTQANLAPGKCNDEISFHIRTFSETVTTCEDKFGTAYGAIMDSLHAIAQSQCAGCSNKQTVLLCMCSRALIRIREAARRIALSNIIKTRKHLDAVGMHAITSEDEIVAEVNKQIQERQSHSTWYGAAMTSVTRVLSPDSDEISFQEEIRTECVEVSTQMSDRNIPLSQLSKKYVKNVLSRIAKFPKAIHKHLLDFAIGEFLRRTIEFETRRLHEMIDWRNVGSAFPNITTEENKRQLIESLKKSETPIIGSSSETSVCDLIPIISAMESKDIQKYAAIPVTCDHCHVIDAKLVEFLPLLKTDKYTDILNIIRNFKTSFLCDIEKRGFYNVNFMRTEIEKTLRELQEKGLGTEEMTVSLLHMCSWALPICISIQIAFTRNNSVRAWLETEKDDLRSEFTRLCKGACQDQLRAKLLCEMLVESFIASLRNNVCTSVLDEFSKGTNGIFCSRSRFEKTVLASLCRKEKFSSYREYITNHNTFVKNWILRYLAKQCLHGGSIDIEAIIKKEITLMLKKSSDVFDSTPAVKEGGNRFEKWLSHFQRNLDKSLQCTINQNCSSMLSVFKEESNIDSFKEECKSTMKFTLKTALEGAVKPPAELTVTCIREWIRNLPRNVHLILAENVMGCEKQCPFCKSLCDDTLKTHSVHFANLHLPTGLGGVKYRGTKKLTTETCTANVASGNGYWLCSCEAFECFHMPKPYRKYKDDYPDWDIKPVTDYAPLLYWKWVLTTFNRDFAEYYRCEPADVTWDAVSKSDALRSLEAIPD